MGFELFSGFCLSLTGAKRNNAEFCKLSLCLQYVSLYFSFYTASSPPFIEMLPSKCIFSPLFYPTFHGCSLPSVGRFLWTHRSCVQEKIHIQLKPFSADLSVKQREDWKVCGFGFSFHFVLFLFQFQWNSSGLEAWSGVEQTWCGPKLVVKSGKL